MNKTITRSALNGLERCFDRHLLGEYVDSLFDAGECGPAHWRQFQHDAAQLARGFGFDGVDALALTANLHGLVTEERHAVLSAARYQEE